MSDREYGTVDILEQFMSDHIARAAALAVLIVIPGTESSAQRTRDHRDGYTEQRSLTEAVRSARVIRISAGAGSLTIEGRSGIQEVRARGTAFAPSRDALAEVRLISRRDGDALEIIADFPDRSSQRWDNDWWGGIDLTIEVPASIPLDVEDGSGDLEVRGVGSIELHDGSGGVRLTDVGGDVRISDGSGEVLLDRVEGSVEVDDGSGTLEARHVKGSVRVGRKGSGPVDVEDVGGDFVVEHKGSGTIDYRDVKGKVDVPTRDRRRVRWRER